MKRATESTAEFERAASRRSGERYLLRLYVAGATRQSTRAIASVHAICAEHLSGRHDLEVIDVYQHPERARADQIVALPTLVKLLPLPVKKLIGDLSNLERVLLGLDLKPTTTDAKEAPRSKQPRPR